MARRLGCSFVLTCNFSTLEGRDSSKITLSYRVCTRLALGRGKRINTNGRGTVKIFPLSLKKHFQVEAGILICQVLTQLEPVTTQINNSHYYLDSITAKSELEII